ncbi:hypothetical protein GF319_09315 [Candidatus Bathyarchaeota archaeon]|nr:hypothetical protein [Candidatus Bathyarchaeota archaeon]
MKITESRRQILGVILLVSIASFLIWSLTASGNNKPKNEETNYDTLITEIQNLNTTIILQEQKIHELEMIIRKYENNQTALTQRIIALENSASSNAAELNSVNSDIESILTQIESAENLELISVSDELEALDHRMDRSEAYLLLKKTMSRPGAYIVSSVTEAIFKELLTRYPAIAPIEGKVKEIIAKAINSKTPSLVWYGRSCDRVNPNCYLTYVVTYFPLEVDTGLPVVGEIIVARVALVVSGQVDVNHNIVLPNTIEVASINLEE